MPSFPNNRRFPRRSVDLQAAGRAFTALMFGTMLAALPVFAQEGGDAATDSPAGHAFRWINFAIIVGLLIFAFAKLSPAFRKKAQEISEKIAEGSRAREAAERQRQEIQAKVANLETEIQQLRVQAKRDAEAEAQRLRDTGRAESEKIEQAARVEIDAAARAGRQELKALGARLSIQLAEAMLRQELTLQAETKLFHSFVAELGRNVN
jgi:F-type H+-transporting ATPase subunit b